MISKSKSANSENLATRYQLIKTPDKLLESLISSVGKAQNFEAALASVVRIICGHYNWPYGEAWPFNPQLNRQRHQPFKGQANSQMNDRIEGQIGNQPNWVALAPDLASEAAKEPSRTTLRKSIVELSKVPARRAEDSLGGNLNPFGPEAGKNLNVQNPICFGQLSENDSFSLGDNVVGRVWDSQQAEWHRDIARAPDVDSIKNDVPKDTSLLTHKLGVSLGIPLVENRRTLAVLVFFSNDQIVLDPKLTEYINVIAVPLAMLIKQKQFQEKLAIERELSQVTLNSIGDAVITTDELGRIRHLNPAAETLTGWAQSAAAGHPVSAVFKTIHEVTRKPTVDPIARVLQKQQAVAPTNCNILITRDGVELPIENSAAPLKTGDGQLIGAVMVFNDVSKTRLLTRQISWQASHDELTGLINRREFERRLSQAVDNASSHQRMHALCYIDLDNFKIINDTCGHASGDKLLKQVSALLTGHIRATDTLARLGGDEFGLLLEYCQLDHAQRIVSLLREKLKSLRFTCQSRTFSVGASIGVTAITAKTQNVEDALSDADAACHVAKRKGRNRTHIHQHNDLELAQQRSEIQWAAYITEALETGKFSLYQQQILSLNASCPSQEHYEVLLRLRDQFGQIVSPDAFMPAAERYDLMPLVDRWVVSRLFETQSEYYQQVWAASQRQTAGQSASEQNMFEQSASAQIAEGSYLYSINLSGASISDDSFIYFLKEQFSKHCIPPALICFEITETATIANLAKAALFIAELRDLGCKFALDDFGSGMSSFAYLKTLPVDYLKIDGRFIRNIVDNKIDTAMVTAIHQIAQVMNIQTVAEFVEDEATLQAIKALGISYAQGYGIAKPAPLNLRH